MVGFNDCQDIGDIDNYVDSTHSQPNVTCKVPKASDQVVKMSDILI